MKCQYPECKLPAKENWALVDLCYEHRKMIEIETFQHYEKRLGYDERLHFLQIAPMIPLAQINKRKRKEGEEA